MCNLSQGVLNHGLTQGRTEGRIEATEVIVMNMLALGKLSLEDVAKCVSLPLADVERLRERQARQ